MIAAAVLWLALASSSDAAAARPMDPKAACRLAVQDRIPPGVYTIAGTFFSDGMHGALLEIPGCEQSFLDPSFEGAAEDEIIAYHQAFNEKCHGILANDWMTGVFTGHFVRKQAQLFGMQRPMMINFFIISAVETKNLDIASIRCAG